MTTITKILIVIICLLLIGCYTQPIMPKTIKSTTVRIDRVGNKIFEGKEEIGEDGSIWYVYTDIETGLSLKQRISK